MFRFREDKRFIWCARILFYTAVTVGFIAAFSPADSSLQPHMHDKLAHTASFFLLACFLHHAHPSLSILIDMLILMVIGIFIEIVQSMLPYRSFEWLDWGADILGATIYFLIWYGITALFQARLPKVENHRSSLD